MMCSEIDTQSFQNQGDVSGNKEIIGSGSLGIIGDFINSKGEACALKVSNVEQKNDREIAFGELEVLLKLQNIDATSSERPIPKVHACELNKNVFRILMTKFYLNIGDKEVIGRVSRMNFRQILMLIIDAAQTLKSIHDLGILHGELQPENMMFINKNLTRIGYINFEHSREKGSTLCKGRGLHMSPEIIFHKVFSGEKNELWSFGTSIGLMIFDHYILSENNYGSIESESETSEEKSPKVSEYVNKMRANFNEEAEQKEEK
jgi:serine/threonine protein kinase